MKGTIAGHTSPVTGWSEQLIKLKSKILAAPDENHNYKEGKKDKTFEKLLNNKKHFLSIYNNQNY